MIFMYTLSCHTSCAISRQVKVLLGLANMEHKVENYNYWEKDGFVPGNVFFTCLN